MQMFGEEEWTNIILFDSGTIIKQMTSNVWLNYDNSKYKITKMCLLSKQKNIT